MRIVVDENISFGKEAFSLFGDVLLLPGREINNEILKHTDILIVRSVTKVDENLLKNTAVKFVGTATIGSDHIDLEYLRRKNITFADAKGCNAFAVAEYFITALMKICSDEKIKLEGKSIGIIGVGNIGSKVAKFSEAVGLKVIRNDPPLQRMNPKEKYYSLQEALNCDIVTLHVPLTFQGEDRTYHLLNEKNFNLIKDNAILINTSRGAVIDNQYLSRIISSKNLKVVLDVWENEPDVNLKLLEKVLITTPHTAGYTLEGKVNGTRMIFEALNRFLGTDYQFDFQLPSVENNLLDFEPDRFDEFEMNNLFRHIYDIEQDTIKMKKMLYFSKNDRIKYFDEMRKYYRLRREFNNYTVKLRNNSLKKLFDTLRFEVIL